MDKLFKPICGREYFSIMYGYAFFIYIPVALIYIFFISNSDLICFVQGLLVIVASLFAMIISVVSTYLRLMDIVGDRKKAKIYTFGIIVLHIIPVINLLCELFLVFKKGNKQPVSMTVKRILLYVLIGLIFFASFYFTKGMYIVTRSMYPTLQVNDKISSMRVIKSTKLNRGDVVLAKRTSSKNKIVNSVYRIIGLPNETIKLVGDKVFINGNLYQDFYAHYNGARPDYLPDVNITLGSEEYYLLGDNRYNSLDSRSIGAFKRKNIISKVISIYWPIERRKYINDKKPLMNTEE